MDRPRWRRRETRWGTRCNRRGPHGLESGLHQNGGETQQLYDLARDPGERTNRFADPAYAATLARLQAGLAGVLDQLDEARGEGAAPEPDRGAARGER